MSKTTFSTLLATIALTMGSAVTLAQQPTSNPAAQNSVDSQTKPDPMQPSFTQGEAKTDVVTLFDWKGANARTSKTGTIMSPDGQQWTTPAKTHFQSGPKAADLYNEANGVTPAGLAEVDLNKVPVIDAGGDEIFTAYVFGDNYFEFYVNGKLLAVDPVPMTPFNSNVIRFKAQRPFTIGVMGVDWSRLE